MRWRFIDPTNREEVEAREAVVARIDAWWAAFTAKTEQITALFKQQVEWDLPGWMIEHLDRISEGLRWEFGPGVRRDGHRLVITPESRQPLRPLVTTILERAPDLPGWEFFDARLAESLKAAKQLVEARVHVDISDFQVRVARGGDHRIDLCYTAPAISNSEDQTAAHAAFVATESLLGEKLLDRWIGAIEVSPAAKKNWLRSVLRSSAPKPRGVIGLERLKDTVEAVVGSIRDQLPEQPCYEWTENADWTLWKLEPEKQDDYCRQDDLLIGKSPNPEFWTAAASRTAFYSERFSRCGETFCYLKLDGSEGLEGEKFADKAEIEDALDAVLKPAKLGCQVGGGTGLRYSYIDLALVDLEAGIEAVRKRLQAGNVPRRSWIQFFDADLAAEWVGVYDDSPQPPMDVDRE
jgi:hypothetical protein